MPRVAAERSRGSAPNPGPPRGEWRESAKVHLRWGDRGGLRDGSLLDGTPKGVPGTPRAAKAKQASQREPWRPLENPGAAKLPDRGGNHPTQAQACRPEAGRSPICSGGLSLPITLSPATWEVGRTSRRLPQALKFPRLMANLLDLCKEISMGPVGLL